MFFNDKTDIQIFHPIRVKSLYRGFADVRHRCACSHSLSNGFKEGPQIYVYNYSRFFHNSVWDLLGSQESLLRTLATFSPSIWRAQCFWWPFWSVFSCPWCHHAIWTLVYLLRKPNGFAYFTKTYQMAPKMTLKISKFSKVCSFLENQE